GVLYWRDESGSCQRREFEWVNDRVHAPTTPSSTIDSVADGSAEADALPPPAVRWNGYFLQTPQQQREWRLRLQAESTAVPSPPVARKLLPIATASTTTTTAAMTT